MLKGRIGFDGFVISDWEGIHQLPGDFANRCDGRERRHRHVHGAEHAPHFVTTLLAEITAGRVTTARIDDAVRRILTKKFELGLFEHPYADRTHLGEWAPPRTGRRPRGRGKSQVLLKNAGTCCH